METAAFIRDLKKSGEAVATNTAKMRQSMRRVEQATTGVQRVFSQLRAGAVALGAALAVRQFANFAKQSLDFADNMAKTADSVGMTTKEFQQFEIAAGLSGVSTEQAGKGLQFFVKSLGEARQGSGKMAETLKKIDKGFLNQVINAKSTNESLSIYLDRMSQTKGAADRAALAVAAFGRSGIGMVNILRDGAQGFNDMKAQAVALGLVLEDNIIRHAEDIKDRMELFKRAFDVGFARGMVVELANSFQLTEDNLKAAKEAGENFGRFVGLALRGLADAAIFVGGNIREIATALTALIALKAAGMFIATAAAVIKFSQALLVAARTGALVDAILSKTVLGALAKLAIALTAGTLLYQQFSGAAENQIKELEDLTRSFDANSEAVVNNKSRIQESIEQKQRDIASWQLLTEKLGEGERAYENARAAIEIANEATRLGVDANTRLGESWLEVSMAAYEAERRHNDVKKAMDEARRSGEDFGQAVGSAFEDAVIELKSLHDVAMAFAKDLARMALRKGFTEPLMSGFGNIFASLFGGGGGGGNTPLNILPPIHHSGALTGVTSSAPRRLVPLASFAGAQTMHGGGIAGFKSDEVPAILRKGEPVFRDMDHARQVVGGRAVVNVHPVVHNASGLPVETSVSDNGQGDITIDTFIPAISAGLAKEQARNRGPLAKVSGRRPLRG